MIRLLLRLYACLLRLYPRRFRAEFADEMCVVFTQALTDAMERGGIAWLSVCWREVRDLPATLWRENAFDREEAEMNENPSSSGFDEMRLSWREIVLGLFPFALGTISLLTSYPFPPPTWQTSIEWQVLTFATYLVPVLVILGIGWAAKFPRWSYPYVGFGLFVLVIVLAEPTRRILMLRDARVQVLASGIMLFLMFGCLALVGYVWRPLRSLYKGVRQDWTRFSFGLYLVAALFASVVDHEDEDFPVLTGAVVAPSLILFFGALACLRSTTKTQRILSMLTALALAVTVRIIEDQLIYAETIAIMGIVTCLPALLEFLPRSEKSARVA